MKDEMMRREIQEAVEAGERALRSLQLAKERLDSARSWGIFDMLGGGFFSDMMKHSRMNDAASYMEDAKRDLQKFQKELRDVHVPTELRMEISGFLTFADFFFDGFIADYMVQTRIADAREQVNSAISRVESLLMDLERMNR